MHDGLARRLGRRIAGLLAAAWLLAVPAAQAAGAATPDPEATRALHALFERHWEWTARTFPEWATFRGDHRFGDRLSDGSAAGLAAVDRATLEFLDAARAIPRERLAPTDRVSRDLFIEMQQRFADEARFPAARGMTLRALGGPQTDFADLLQLMPVDRADRVRQLLARMAALPRRMDDEIVQLRASAAAGWVPARPVLERVLQQIDGQIGGAVEETPYFEPFRRLGREIPEAERSAYAAAGRDAIAAHVRPAMRRLRALVEGELLPKAPAEVALLHYPDGPQVYAMRVRHETTTELTPQQVHELGRRELARLRAGMDEVMRAQQWRGSLAGFVAALRSDPKHFHASPEALLAGYRDIAKRIDAELPKLFAELPRTPYGVLAMPAHLGPDSAEYYQPPALDGSRAGFFFANTQGWRKRPLWSMETLVAHETVPGHHLQGARAAELRGLPEFRRSYGPTAYFEGWALYAETLGFELGLYQDPLSRFGHQLDQALRAARLVVDTGLHAFGWSRQRALDFMVEEAGVEPAHAASEVDRYTSDPAQALGYMIGKLKFDELRERAKARLGGRFDVRRFHNAVIDQGALPLATLDALVDEWIESEKNAEETPK